MAIASYTHYKSRKFSNHEIAIQESKTPFNTDRSAELAIVTDHDADYNSEDICKDPDKQCYPLDLV